MYKGKTISVIFPAFNEEKNIVPAIEEFQALGIIDEIVVVNNNSRDRTVTRARSNGARVVNEKKQGYGFALKKGLTVAKGNFIVLAEPDGTFDARDLGVLLKKMANTDCVLGSRTHLSYILPGANMKFFLRLGNITLAKIMQLLFQLTPMSDCGCTFRVFKREV